MLHTGSNPWRKDAEGAGRFLRDYLAQERKKGREPEDDVVRTIARWAGHWGRLALRNT